MNEAYRNQVALLIRVMPLVLKIKDFAVHGGTAINLFHRNLNRYSVDIDITYIPMTDRDSSLKAIITLLVSLKNSLYVYEQHFCVANRCNIKIFY